MEVKERYESNLKNSHLILFGFELNHSQTVLFLNLSLIGVFLLPSILAGAIFYNLFQSVFVALPSYHEFYQHYHLYYENYEHFLFGIFAPVITSIIVYSILLGLSIYALKKILRAKEIKNEQKRNIITQDRIVNWLGFKLSHGQSLFIFSVSLAGILLTVQSFIDSFIPTYDWDLFKAVCEIPTYSEGGTIGVTSHEILLNNVPIAINAIFLTFCLYSLISTRGGKPITPSKKVAKNYSLLIFIPSFIVTIFLLARLFCHLALFNYEFSYILGVAPHAPNSDQNNDFIRIFVFLIICLALMVSSYFIKESPYENTRTNNKVKWFRIRLTPNRAIILISLAILFITFFIFEFLIFSITFGIDLILIWYHVNYFNILFQVILVIVIVLCYYSIEKVLKKRGLDEVINEIDNLGEFETKWFKFRLNRLYSNIFLSVSSGVIVLYVFQLIIFNMDVRYMISEMGIYADSYSLFSVPIMISVLGLLIAINIYTIKRTLPSLKFNQ